MTYITPLSDLDPVARPRALVDHASRRIIKPSNAKAPGRIALIKCMTCKVPQPMNAFYTSKSGRASPHCIACNPDAALKARYRKQLRSEGAQGFAKRIARKEHQLDLMLKAVIEFQRAKYE